MTTSPIDPPCSTPARVAPTTGTGPRPLACATRIAAATAAVLVGLSGCDLLSPYEVRLTMVNDTTSDVVMYNNVVDDEVVVRAEGKRRRTFRDNSAIRLSWFQVSLLEDGETVDFADCEAFHPDATSASMHMSAVWDGEGMECFITDGTHTMPADPPM